ncbi:diaminopimelate epimerase [Micrococcus sp.]|uniref:diaminopimelate epimerase n=1 Tax=Micrococcus sp. TaxID=1271 RepID=UPI002A9144FC|nr:diaminopimelate epimerase [Micrococcus sp.]MDY6055112.1 diaminopimelate epimerase [Micrococcus sp.]
MTEQPQPRTRRRRDAETAHRPSLPFTKGHGTGNDFVLIADPEGNAHLEPEQVARLADRHQGIGADGVIRAVRSARLPEGETVLAEHPEAEWFMDYRNGDGSTAEMCGNGVRVFVHFLVESGLVELTPGQSLTIGTRAGARTVTRLERGYSIDMGTWTLLEPEQAEQNASDALVRLAGLPDPRPALSISMGNPHTVVPLTSLAELQTLDLHEAPLVEPVPPHGTNVEFVAAHEPLVAEGVGRVRMRVHERGVGETQSCGTGACAAAAAMRLWAGAEGSDSWLVEVPGGVLGVDFVAGGDGQEHVVLSGPAELVFEGELTA